MTIAQARSDATLALTYWDVDHYGRPLIPVDPVKIARTLGLLIYASELDDDVSGVLVKQNGGIPAIHLNVRDAPVRQRFSCAHEIGHFWRRGAVDNFGYVDKRDALASAGTDPEEIYANRFAAELLMPAQYVRDLATQGAKPESLAARFGVSLDAMRYRFFNLGLK
jgi:Zn-dependent peptidase ImmA (M78 family)